MGLLGDYGRYRVPFEFEGMIIHLKITKYTTFNDVIHTLTSRTGMSNYNMKLYTAFECTRDLDRKIGGEVRVLSIWRSWGCETRHFRFVVKYKNNLMIKTLSRSSDEGIESEIDSIFCESYRQAENIRNNADDLGEISTKKGLSDATSTSICYNEVCHKLGPSETCLKPTKVQSRNEKGGKMAILTKYLNDLKIFNRRKRKQIAKDSARGETEETFPSELRGNSQCTEMENSLAHIRTNRLERTLSMANCQYYWEKHRDCDSDSEMSEDYLDSEIDTDDESELSVYSTYAFDTCSMDLDTAFVKSSRDSVSDEGIDVTSVISSDLNDAFVFEYRNKNVIGTDGYNFSCNVDENERIITTSAFVRKMFGADDAHSVGSQDEEIDSFMRSRLDSF